MAKDYGRRGPTRRKSSAPKQLFWMLASFLGGYLTATVFDFTSLSSWVNANILAKHSPAKPAAKAAVKEPELPKPKFEFYTLLAKDGSSTRVVPITKPTSAAQTKPAAQLAADVGSVRSGVPARQVTTPASAVVAENKPTTSARETYQIQIASFKNRQDAEHMKASMTLKGFDVTIVAISQPQGNWFRVIVGPFNSRATAEKTQLTLAKSEHLKGMIQKIES